MTGLAYTIGVLLFVVGLAVSIGLHEVGHLVFGKLFGVKVTQYFVGFGKTIWSTRRGETEYGVKAVPLGGFVKMIGMIPPGEHDEPGKLRDSNTGVFSQMISDARAAEYEHVDPADMDRVFYRLAWWRRVIVLGAGATVNIVLAFLMFAAVFMIHGVPAPTTKVSQVSDCVIAVTRANADLPQRHCKPSDKVSPARLAGLRKGDRFVSFNDTLVHSWAQLTRLIRANRDGSATIVVRRNGHQVTTNTNTTVSPRSESAAHPRTIVRVGFLGVSPKQVLVTHGPGYVVSTMAGYTWKTLQAMGTLPGKLVGVGKAALGLEPRAEDSPMSVVGASRVAGQVAADHQIPLADRLFGLLALLGGVNLFVGLFNFVPLPPLDGGPIAGALYEALRRAFARAFRRPDPGYFDVGKLLPLTYVMVGVIVLASVVLIYADIVAPVQLG